MKKLFVVTAFFLCLFPAVLAPAADTPDANAVEQATDLQPHFQAGRKSRYEIWMMRDNRIILPAAGRSQSAGTHIEVKSEVTWLVEKVKPDGGATCVMTIDWISADYTNAAGEKTENDSRRAAGGNEAIHKLVRAMAGVPVRIELAADGSVLSASGAEVLERKIGKEFHPPNNLDFMESASDLATIIAAPKQTQLKDKWTARNTWNHELGKINVSLEQTLVSVEDIAGIPVANVTGRGNLSLEPDITKVFPKELLNQAGSPQIDIKLKSGSLNTQVMYDLQRHEAIGRNSTQETQIEIRLKVKDQTLTESITNTIQSQTLRIEED